MTHRIQPQSRLPTTGLSSGLFGGQVTSSLERGDATPAHQAVGRADRTDEASTADTLA